MKIYLVAIIATASLYGIDFETFEAKALQRSPAVLSAKLQNDIAVLEKDMALRYANPQIEVEAGIFRPESQKRQNGWRLGVSQPFRVFGLQNDLKDYGEKIVLLAEAEYARVRAYFSTMLRRSYTDYVRTIFEKRLLKEEISLAKRLESIAKERFENGGGTKAALMQASLERISAQSRLIEYEREIVAQYYRLVNLAGMNKRVELEARFLYGMEIDGDNREKDISSPDIAVEKNRERLLLSEAKTKSRRVESYTIMGEFEKEPDQSIVRLGVSLELPLFNRSNQEYRTAMIMAKQAALQREKLETSQQIRLSSLTDQLEILKKRYGALRSQLEKEERLLTLFEEGYKVAQSSLLDLIKTKNSLIETRRQLLETIYLGNIYRIEIDYLKGKYDE